VHPSDETDPHQFGRGRMKRLLGESKEPVFSWLSKYAILDELTIELGDISWLTYAPAYQPNLE